MAAPSGGMYQYDVKNTTVFADAKGQVLAQRTRWEYFGPYIKLWREATVLKWYSIGLFVVGAWAIFNVPVVTVPAFAASMYLYVLAKSRFDRCVSSSRHVFWNH